MNNTVLETVPGDVTPYEYFSVSPMFHFSVWLPFNCFHLRLAFENGKSVERVWKIIV